MLPLGQINIPQLGATRGCGKKVFSLVLFEQLEGRVCVRVL